MVRIRRVKELGATLVTPTITPLNNLLRDHLSLKI